MNNCNRENLRPVFRGLPRWALVVLVVSGLPVYLFMGVLLGIRDGVESWVAEVRDTWNIDTQEQLEDTDE